MPPPVPTPRPYTPTVHAVVAGVAWSAVQPEPAFLALTALGALSATRAVTGDVRADTGRGALLGALWALGFTDWVATAWRDAGAPHLWGLLVVLILCQAFAVGLVHGLASWMHREAELHPGVALAILWTLLSPQRWLPLPFVPGTLLAGWAPVAWPAAWLGLSGLTVLLLVAGTFPDRRSLLALAIWLPGTAWVAATPPTSGPIPVGIALPDVAALDGHRSSTARDRALRLVTQVEAARDAGARVVFTPETTWPLPIGTPGSHMGGLFAEAWQGQPPTALGVRMPDGPTNAYVAVDDGRVTATVAKAALVPWHERRVAGLGRDAWAPGLGAHRLSLGGLRVGVALCYEDLVPWVRTEMSARSVDLLATPTNDAWTDDEGDAWHLAAARMLALESGRWVVRPANGGASVVFDPWGRTLWHAPAIPEDADDSLRGRHGVASVGTARPAWTGRDGARLLTVMAIALVLLSLRIRWPGEV